MNKNANKSSVMRRFFLACQFLTILPVGRMENISKEDVGGSSAFFPAVGAVQGGLTVLSAAICIRVFPFELANGFVILVAVVINGGLHLDGLADTFDAVASRKDKDRKLAIMKDSSVGPFGVMAIVMALLLKYIALNALYSGSLPFPYYSPLFLMPVLSRWSMVAAAFHTTPARQDGLGEIFIEHTRKKEFFIATLSALALLMSILIVSYKTAVFPFHLSAFITALPVLYTFSVTAVWFSKRNFGGMTGDTFGAVSEISEILFLISVILWSQSYI